MTTDQEQSQGQPTSGASAADGGEIVARAGRYYRNTRYLMFVLLVGMGVWFGYDGWVGWPRENAIVDDLRTQQRQAESQGAAGVEKLKQINTELKNHKEHTHSDLRLQRVLAIALPPLGLAMLIWALRQSRGAYRMSGTKLSVPGHPTIDLSEIKSVNNDLWDRKGIAWVKYETADGQSGEIKLDDFLYDRPPTDAIYERIAEHMGLETEDEDDDDDVDEDDDEDGDEEVDEQQDVGASEKRED